jgi:hypothetical protein
MPALHLDIFPGSANLRAWPTPAPTPHHGLVRPPASRRRGGRWCSRPAARAGADAALEKFCAAYWYPVYAFIRRRGHAPDDARDLTQEFFARLIEKDWLAGVERRETRFSTLLLTILKRFLVNEYERNQTRSGAAESRRFPSMPRKPKRGSARAFDG